MTLEPKLPTSHAPKVKIFAHCRQDSVEHLISTSYHIINMHTEHSMDFSNLSKNKCTSSATSGRRRRGGACDIRSRPHRASHKGYTKRRQHLKRNTCGCGMTFKTQTCFQSVSLAQNATCTKGLQGLSETVPTRQWHKWCVCQKQKATPKAATFQVCANPLHQTENLSPGQRDELWKSEIQPRLPSEAAISALSLPALPCLTVHAKDRQTHCPFSVKKSKG